MHYAARYDTGSMNARYKIRKQGRYAVTNSLFMRIQSRFPSDLSKVLIETAEGTTYSYGDADAASARIAGLLTALGAQKGDRVAVQGR